MIKVNIKKMLTHNLEIMEDIFEDTLPLSHTQTFQPIKYSYFNFVCTITNMLEDYIRSNRTGTFNIFFVDHYVQRHLPNI